MNWYNNMKLKGKFGIMSTVITLLIVITVLLSAVVLKDTTNKYNDVVESNRELIEESVHITNVLSQVRFAQLRLDGSQSALAMGKFDEARQTLKGPYEEAKQALMDLEQLLINLDANSDLDSGVDKKNEIASVEKIIKDLDTYYEKYLEHIDLHEQGVFHDENGKLTQGHIEHLEEVRSLADSMFGNIDTDGEVFTVALSNFGDMIDRLDYVSESEQFKILFIALIGVIVILFTVVQVIIISRNIRKPIDSILEATDNIQNGNIDIDIRSNNTDEMGILSNAISNIVYIFQGILNDINELSSKLNEGNIEYRINTEKYSGVFKEATESINEAIGHLISDTLTILDTVDGFTKGNFNANITDFPGQKVLATKTLREIQTSLKSVAGEINGLIEAANNGDLEYKIDGSKYAGDWKNVINGLNEFVDNVVVPIKETQNALNQFSVGNFKHRITNEYKGEFNNIKETVNYTADTIESYISEITDTLQEMANKNFNVSIDREYLGDFKAIQQATNLIIENLNVLIRDIISSAEQVSVGSKQISESSIALAEGATEQAESVEKLNNIIKLISEQTSENTRGSNKANSLAIETKENASKGSKQMDSMLVAMEEINTAASNISNIIKVIDDIAFQTNILALNAAVEAARAGEHGKGFAVVAEEVRNLAGRSQQAARETTELIESSVQKVEEGSKIANSTAEALLAIVKQIEGISELSEASTKSSNKQERSINEIIESISQISTVTQNNTATSEESAAAAEELASQAEVFYASVADFKLKE